jgi:hypothetical protein
MITMQESLVIDIWMVLETRHIDEIANRVWRDEIKRSDQTRITRQTLSSSNILSPHVYLIGCLCQLYCMSLQKNMIEQS